MDGFLKNLSSAGKETSRSSSFIHLKVVSGSKKDKYTKVTPCPLLVMCKVVLDDTWRFNSSIFWMVVLVTLVSKIRKVIGVIALVLD